MGARDLHGLAHLSPAPAAGLATRVLKKRIAVEGTPGLPTSFRL